MPINVDWKKFEDFLSSPLDVPPTREQLNTLLVDATLQRKFQVHPYGFLVLNLGAVGDCYELRLHVWLADFRPRQEPDWPPHTHPGHFHSFVLEGVVKNGTAKNIFTSHYKIAGKTGTAETLKNGRYTNDYNTSFVGYFPADDPLYSCIVVIENPKGIYKYGNNVAAPVFKEIADKIYAGNIEMHKGLAVIMELPYGIFPVIRSGNVDDLKLICNDLGISNHALGDEAWVRSRIKNNSIEWRDNQITSGMMPDVTGMTLRDALFVLENQGLRVKYEGMGRVTKQSWSPGKRLSKGTWINLKLG